MTMTAPTEQLVEDVASVYFGALGISTKRGVEIDDAGERGDTVQCVLQGRLTAVLHRLNPVLPHGTIEEVVRVVSHPPHPTLIQNNRWFHTLLTDGVEVEYPDAASGEMRGGRARLVDFENPGANDLLVVRQLTVVGPSGTRIRPDLTVFLNGLPVAVIELKDPADVEADLGVAIEQLGRYKEAAPDLFVPNLALVVSDGLLTRVGSITSDHRPVHALASGGGRRADPGGADSRAVRTTDVGRLPTDLRLLRGGRTRRDRQEDRGVPPVPRCAKDASQRSRSS